MKRKHRLSPQRRRYPNRQRRRAVAGRVADKMFIAVHPAIYEAINVRMKDAYMSISSALVAAMYSQPLRINVLNGRDCLTLESFDAE